MWLIIALSLFVCVHICLLSSIYALVTWYLYRWSSQDIYIAIYWLYLADPIAVYVTISHSKVLLKGIRKQEEYIVIKCCNILGVVGFRNYDINLPHFGGKKSESVFLRWKKPKWSPMAKVLPAFNNKAEILFFAKDTLVRN